MRKGESMTTQSHAQEQPFTAAKSATRQLKFSHQRRLQNILDL
jgi:L-lactate dehydrogenase (cytochrome)